MGWRDSKSAGTWYLAGSIPVPGTSNSFASLRISPAPSSTTLRVTPAKRLNLAVQLHLWHQPPRRTQRGVIHTVKLRYT